MCAVRGAAVAGAAFFLGPRMRFMDSNEVYDNPLVTRYASRRWPVSGGRSASSATWRRLWVALAEAEHELGLLADDGTAPRIRPPSWPSCAHTSTTSTSPRPTSTSAGCATT